MQDDPSHPRGYAVSTLQVVSGIESISEMKGT